VGRSNPPIVVALSGPNGAGKSTAGPNILKDTLGVMEFVNADAIAQGMSVFAPGEMAVAAGRIMLTRLRDLARRRESFAFETTLAGRGHAIWVRELRKQGYEFHLIYLWLPSAEFAVTRVRNRVRFGGHSVPAETIRRRYVSGLRNLFELYRPIAATWRIYDNSEGPAPELIASGTGNETVVRDVAKWTRIERQARR
jgi:predicted ABC-type ATPase